MCSINVQAKDPDMELVNYISSISDMELKEYTLKELKEMGNRLGISGMKSILVKDKAIAKLRTATNSLLSATVGSIPNLVYLILDTETTLGFGTGRLLQLGYQIYKKDTLIKERNLYVLPCGFPVTGTEIHGISEDMLLDRGIPIKEVLNTFTSDIKEYEVNVIVAHNLPFDWDVLQREAIQADISILDANMSSSILSLCTCRTSSILTYMQVKNNLKRAVFPSLENLYNTLFNAEIQVEHSALADVKVDSMCLFELFKLGIIGIKDMKPIASVNNPIF